MLLLCIGADVVKQLLYNYKQLLFTAER